jgi:hypothetical protein
MDTCRSRLVEHVDRRGTDFDISANVSANFIFILVFVGG